MPLVKFNVAQSLSKERLAGLCNAVHDALLATAKVPPDDRFHVIHRHEASCLLIERCSSSHPGHLGVSDLALSGKFRQQALLARGREPHHP